jgi:hypothetical protein
MIGIKCEAKQLLDYKINHHELKAEFPPEKKEDKKNPEKTFIYYPSCKYDVSLYKEPGTAILSGYMPMFILAWVLMTTF